MSDVATKRRKGVVYLNVTEVARFLGVKYNAVSMSVIRGSEKIPAPAVREDRGPNLPARALWRAQDILPLAEVRRRELADQLNAQELAILELKERMQE